MEEKILCVDDDELALSFLEMVLHRRKFKNIILATSGQEGIDKFILERPDLVVTDIIMPGDLNGIQMANKIKVFDDKIPIIFVSSDGDYKKELELLNYKHFMKKPLNFENLVIKIISILEV